MPMRIRNCALLLICCSLVTVAYAENKVLGELELAGSIDIERASGVWVDGQYLGYLKELK